MTFNISCYFLLFFYTITGQLSSIWQCYGIRRPVLRGCWELCKTTVRGKMARYSKWEILCRSWFRPKGTRGNVKIKFIASHLNLLLHAIFRYINGNNKKRIDISASWMIIIGPESKKWTKNGQTLVFPKWLKISFWGAYGILGHF